jgi:hypothetical protein
MSKRLLEDVTVDEEQDEEAFVREVSEEADKQPVEEEKVVVVHRTIEARQTTVLSDHQRYAVTTLVSWKPISATEPNFYHMETGAYIGDVSIVNRVVGNFLSRNVLKVTKYDDGPEPCSTTSLACPHYLTLNEKTRNVVVGYIQLGGELCYAMISFHSNVAWNGGYAVSWKAFDRSACFVPADFHFPVYDHSIPVSCTTCELFTTVEIGALAANNVSHTTRQHFLSQSGQLWIKEAGQTWWTNTVTNKTAFRVLFLPNDCSRGRLHQLLVMNADIKQT